MSAFFGVGGAVLLIVVLPAIVSAAIRDGLEADITGDTDKKLALYGPAWPGAWPEDLCAYPPCDREDRWECASHQPRGKHHRLSIVHTPPYDDSLTEKFSIADYSQVIELHERRRP